MTLTFPPSFSFAIRAISGELSMLSAKNIPCLVTAMRRSCQSLSMQIYLFRPNHSTQLVIPYLAKEICTFIFSLISSSSGNSGKSIDAACDFSAGLTKVFLRRSSQRTRFILRKKKIDWAIYPLATVGPARFLRAEDVRVFVETLSGSGTWGHHKSCHWQASHSTL